MDNKTLKAEVRINLEAPLSITMPTAEYQSPNKWDNFPVMPMGYQEGEPILTGYLPATTLRGALRRHATIPAIKRAAEEGKHHSLDRIYADLIGQDAASEAQSDEVDLLAIQNLREDSAIVDLFGSGLSVKSRMMVSMMVPGSPVLPEAFTAVRKDLDDAEGVLEAMSADDQTAFVKRSQANSQRSQAESLVKKLNRQVTAARKKGDAALKDLEAQQAAAQKLVDKYEADMGSMKNSSRSLMSHYALGQGLELRGKIVVRNFRDRDLDILTQAFDGLSQWPILGAQAARGCGEISGTVDFKKDGVLFKKLSFGGYEPARVQDF